MLSIIFLFTVIAIGLTTILKNNKFQYLIKKIIYK